MKAKRPEAIAVVTRALARRDFSVQGLRDRLERAGIEPGEADEVLATLERAGVLRDERFAAQRALALAERGQGDTAIRFDLGRQGVAPELADDAIASLKPERERVLRIVSSHGPGPKTARLLARRGFDPELVELAAKGSVAPGP